MEMFGDLQTTFVIVHIIVSLWLLVLETLLIAHYRGWWKQVKHGEQVVYL